MSSNVKSIRPKASIQIPEPPIARFLFADTRMAWVWLIVRLYVGYQWLIAGTEKLFGYNIDFTSKGFGTGDISNSWIFTSHLGAALTGFAHSGIAQATGAHPAVQGWYAWFLQNVVIPGAGFWSYLVTFGEVAVGIGLIIGMLTGIAAFFGVFMNMNFLLAGAVSINPIIGGLAIFLILAWRIAGYYGVDRWLLPLLGTPWTGSLAKEEAEKPKQATTPPVPSVS
ncbi:MAG TPA: DoxX family protein [Ktedonobacteraceae bacterium]|nr:DoxX family protein [Ktedonobacteraceae bacterium]